MKKAHKYSDDCDCDSCRETWEKAWEKALLAAVKRENKTQKHKNSRKRKKGG